MKENTFIVEQQIENRISGDVQHRLLLKAAARYNLARSFNRSRFGWSDGRSVVKTGIQGY